MHDHDLDALARAARRGRRVRPGSACAACGTTDHLMTQPDGRILCYADRRALTGATGTEADHVAGRANLGGLLIDLRANDHRTVTELRTRLGIDDWPVAEGDPLLVLAHLVAGVATILILGATWLVVLATDTTARLGTDVWDGAPKSPFVP